MSGPGVFPTILAFLACIGPLVFIHELGHYWAGRLFGVRAETFSIGFGREVGGWTDRRGTRWKIGWLPLGGYVKFAGDMNPASVPTPEWLALPAEERNRTFQAKPLWQRAIIVAAGPAVNFLFAILAFAAIFAAVGYPTDTATVGSVVAGSPAAGAGLRPADRIVEIDGSGIATHIDLLTHVTLRPDEEMRVVFLRDGARRAVTLRSRAEVQRDDFGNAARVGRIGIVPATFGGRTALAPVELAETAVRQTARTVEAMVVALGQVIGGRRALEELGGPLKIAEVSGQQASLGWLPFFWLMAVISINLGFINLLPVPLLDGGHLLFYLLEAVRRRPLPPQAQEWAFRAGLAALLTLMLFVTFNDLGSFGVWNRLGGLIG